MFNATSEKKKTFSPTRITASPTPHTQVTARCKNSRKVLTSESRNSCACQSVAQSKSISLRVRRKHGPFPVFFHTSAKYTTSSLQLTVYSLQFTIHVVWIVIVVLGCLQTYCTAVHAHHSLPFKPVLPLSDCNCCKRASSVDVAK